ncbi:hypothetical protein NDA01_24010 [Trichocoleus desertorum AS-A10]|uniref:hypothetical protein n=1 Tax=Trichocoleus desertorum TaxID=1481672 RepID=UPI003297E5A3
MEILLLALLILGFILLTGGTGEKTRSQPPPPPEPTKQDKAIIEWLWGQFGGAITSMSDSGKCLLIERIKNAPDRSIK